jgi:hypothetical protein
MRDKACNRNVEIMNCTFCSIEERDGETIQHQSVDVTNVVHVCIGYNNDCTYAEVSERECKYSKHEREKNQTKTTKHLPLINCKCGI